MKRFELEQILKPIFAKDISKKIVDLVFWCHCGDPNHCGCDELCKKCEGNEHQNLHLLHCPRHNFICKHH
jgi:hypothetical protein